MSSRREPGPLSKGDQSTYLTARYSGNHTLDTLLSVSQTLHLSQKVESRRWFMLTAHNNYTEPNSRSSLPSVAERCCMVAGISASRHVGALVVHSYINVFTRGVVNSDACFLCVYFTFWLLISKHHRTRTTGLISPSSGHMWTLLRHTVRT